MGIDAFRVVIWPNDHRPAHVHVKGTECEAVFNLDCPDCPPKLRESFGLRLAELNALADELTRAVDALCAEWEAIHGGY